MAWPGHLSANPRTPAAQAFTDFPPNGWSHHKKRLQVLAKFVYPRMREVIKIHSIPFAV